MESQNKNGRVKFVDLAEELGLEFDTERVDPPEAQGLPEGVTPVLAHITRQGCSGTLSLVIGSPSEETVPPEAILAGLGMQLLMYHQMQDWADFVSRFWEPSSGADGLREGSKAFDTLAQQDRLARLLLGNYGVRKLLALANSDVHSEVKKEGTEVPATNRSLH